MIDAAVAIAGALVGFVVGLTGMGGGALMTPLLVLVFGIPPLAAVSNDIVASMIMRPIGGGVHWKRGTVNWPLVKWLALGSIPSAFLGVLILRRLGVGIELQGMIKSALGAALLIASVGLVARPLLAARKKPGESQLPFYVKPLPTVAIGIIGGMLVGVTSVGSGTLMILLLLILYPRLRLSELVGTDLVQAVPLVASAALGHLLFGDFRFSLTGSILVGGIPGVFLGAQFSSRAPDYVIRPALIVVLLGSALKLFGMPNAVVAGCAAVAAVLGGLVAIRVRGAVKRAQRVAGGTPEPESSTPGA